MNDACIPFGGYVDPKGYGRQRKGGVSDRAHRHAYREHHGPIPPGTVVRHKCDNPRCINPDHLELGTQADNVQDMIDRGRMFDRSGEANSRSTLTDAQVAEIKKRLAQPYWGQVRQLAREFNTHESNISHIKGGRRWTCQASA